MDNMDIWNKLKSPPDWATKKITGGRLNGKSDISPMWRIQAMTEQFGMCGIGWKYNLREMQIVDASEGQKMLFVTVELFVRVDGVWSDAILGFGGDMPVVKEKSGLYSNDEAMKMAITDALGNAMKNLGMAATVYSNGVDGTKYNRPQPAQQIAGMISDNQRKRMFALITEVGWTPEQAKAKMEEMFHVDSSSKLTSNNASVFINYLMTLKGDPHE